MLGTCLAFGSCALCLSCAFLVPCPLCLAVRRQGSTEVRNIGSINILFCLSSTLHNQRDKIKGTIVGYKRRNKIDH